MVVQIRAKEDADHHGGETGVCYRMRATLSRWRFPLFTATLVVLWSATPAFPWGCEGHRTVALIALKQLGPGALAKVH